MFCDIFADATLKNKQTSRMLPCGML